MAKKITGEDLFDVGSFNQATNQIVELIKSITTEINLAKTASGELSSELGKSLKSEIEKISSTSKNLEKELEKVKSKFEQLKTTINTSNGVIKKYETENKKLESQLKKVQEQLIKAKTAQEAKNKSQNAGSISSAKLSQSLIGVASGAALVYKGISILKEQLVAAIKSTMEFETAMKQVEAITRSSSEEIEALTENANRLGATTEKTAVQIANLQKELARLGFNTTEIIASTDAIVDLSTATGEDLAKSATVAAATLRAFGLEAIEMGRVVDVMAGSFVRSGLDLEKFRESMKLVAPIARAANIDIETTTAALSKLADAGLSGSLAGTALRNLFSNMADPTSKLSKELGFAVTNSDDLIVAFKKLRDDGIGLAEAVELVDVRARPAFFTLLNQVDAVEQLSLEYRILDGEASDIADTMRDTLANDVDIANSAFDALRRNLTEEFVPAMRSSVQGATLLAETMRFLLKDLTDFNDKLKETKVEGEQQISMISGLVSAWGALTSSVKTYVSSSRARENIDATSEALDRNSEAMGGVIDKFELFSDLKAISEDVEKGILDKSVWFSIISFQKELGTGFDDIFEAIDRGSATYEEGAKLIQGRLLEQLTTSKNTFEQQEATLKVLNEQLAVHEKKYGVELKFNSEQHIQSLELKNKINLTRTFITENEKSYKLLTDLFEKLNKPLPDPKVPPKKDPFKKDPAKKVTDLITLENKLAQEKLKGLILVNEQKQKDEKSSISEFERITLAKDLTDQRLKLLKLELDAELHNISLVEDGLEQSQTKKLIALEKYYAKVFKLGTESSKEMISAEKNLAKKAKDIGEKSLKDSIKLFKAKQKLAEDDAKAKEAALKKKKEDEEENLKEILNMVARGLQEVAKITTQIFNNSQVKRENELVAIDNWEKRRIELAGDNAEAIQAIEDEATKKRNEVKTRQAKSDKKEAMFQIAIQTAIGIARALAQGGLIMAGIVAALGAVQMGVVANRPLPEFYKGTDNSPEGLAVVGDRYGRELIQDGKTGEYRMTPDKSTIQYLSGGSKVFTNKETERILSGVDHNGIAVSKLNSENKNKIKPDIDYNKLGKTFEDAVTKIPVSTTNFDQNGVRTFVTKGRNRTERLNNRYKY